MRREGCKGKRIGRGRAKTGEGVGVEEKGVEVVNTNSGLEVALA